MAKNKPDGLTHYELLYIVSNQFSEDELTPIKDKVEGIITEHEGTITFKEDLGKKRLAYKIKQFRHGYYELVEFDAPSASLPAINDLLRLMSDLIRHQILKTVAKTAEQKQAEAKIISQLISDTASEPTKEFSKKETASVKDSVESKDFVAPRAKVAKETSSEVAPVVEEASPVISSKPEEVTETKEAPVVKETKEERKVADAKSYGEPKTELSDLDLDDKLNQILNTDSLL
jgi:small subunit ribosomal protein S6